MSAKGIVAAGTARHWRGVLNPLDSYPTELGHALRERLSELVRDGVALEAIGRELLQFNNWLDFYQAGICPYCGQYASAAARISPYLREMPVSSAQYRDPGCKMHEHPYPRNAAKLQWTEEQLAESDAAWVYIIDPYAHVVHVLDSRCCEARHVGYMLLHETGSLRAIECGADLSRCHHLAWVHFPEIDPNGPCGRLTTAAYVGDEPMTRHEFVLAYIVGGERYERQFTTAFRGNLQAMGECPVPNAIPDAWYEEVKDRNGASLYLPVVIFRDGVKAPYPGVTWIFPPTRVNPRETQMAS